MNHSQIKQYISLIRLNKPIGILLLLWPTLWALWLAADGKPHFKIVCIFILGVILMRSAGCIINDIADRHFDAHVARTRERPIAAGKISTRSALLFFGILCLCAFLLVLQLNGLVISLAVVAALLAIIYPYMKRYTHLPQVGLGIAFAWAVPMAFAAETYTVSTQAWLVFFAAAVWPVIYDTMYALVDRTDDIQIGIKSTAILFGKYTGIIMGGLQILFLWLLMWVGILFNLHWPYFLSMVAAGLLCGYQQWLIKDGEQTRCFQAFLNNHWVGLVVFLGILFNKM